MEFETPILLITFNRPEYTRKVLERILAVNPLNLYVFQDGIRTDNANDVTKCTLVRKVVEDSTSKHMKTSLHTFFSEKNLGCGLGPMTGISWFFENVEQGIILEDDCFAHPDFFCYCEELLKRYKNDERISFIGGCNFQDGNMRSNGSYYFSMGHHGTWGWASWRRTWRDFDYYLSDMSLREFRRNVMRYNCDLRFLDYWETIFEKVKKNRMNESAWDYQFYFSCWRKHQFAIMPNVNLVSNIGSGEDATHTRSDSAMLESKTCNIFPIIHPSKVGYNREADMFFHRTYIAPYNYGWSGFKRFPYRLNRRLKKLLGHEGSWIKRI